MEEILIRTAELQCYLLINKVNYGFFYHDGLKWHRIVNTIGENLGSIQWVAVVRHGFIEEMKCLCIEEDV